MSDLAVVNEPEAVYRAADGWNVSAVNLLPDEPAMFYGYHVAKPPLWEREASKAMDVGTILHAALLLDVPVPVIPRNVLNADGHRKGKAWLDWKAENPGPALTEPEAEPIGWMLRNVRGNPVAMTLLESAPPERREVSLYWIDDATGLTLKGRADAIAMLGPQHCVVVDIKTTASTSERSFMASIADRKYHRQAAWYMTGANECLPIPCESFAFICVRNEPPYDCVVWQLCERAISRGQTENAEALHMLRWRLEHNDWLGEKHGQCNLIDLPKWVYEH
jgi:hypothetical protein